MRNQGVSDHPPGACSMALHVQDLAALLRGLGIERAHLAGISYGGEVAQRFALEFPQMVHAHFISSAGSEVRPLLAARIKGWMETLGGGDGELRYRCSVADNFYQ